MICDYCLQGVEEKWMHYIDDTTFIGGSEFPTINYNFCNNCWAKITRKVNPERENIYCKEQSWAIDEKFKTSLYPEEPQPINYKTVNCPRCRERASLIDFKLNPYCCMHCFKFFEAK
jgi:hypothetical protein